MTWPLVVYNIAVLICFTVLSVRVEKWWIVFCSFVLMYFHSN